MSRHMTREIYFKRYKFLTFSCWNTNKHVFSNSFHANLLKALVCKLFSLCGALCLKRLLLPHDFIFRLCGPLSWNGKKCILIFVFVLYFRFMSTDSRGMVVFNYTVQCAENVARDCTVLLLKVFCAHRPQPPCL